MSTDMDFRGVQRDKCSRCSCDQYNGGSEGKKCVDCGHPPGQHCKKGTGATFESVVSHSLAPTQDSSDEQMDTFDLNTGLQHSDSLSLSVSPQSLSLSRPPVSLAASRKRSPVKPHRHPGTVPHVRSQSAGSQSAASRSLTSLLLPWRTHKPTPATATVPPTVPPDQQCKLSGCTRKKFVELNGHMHDFCGRTHAREYEKQTSEVPPELQCKTPGCYKQRHPTDQGTYYDYCSIYCRDNGVKSKDMPMLASPSTPNMALTSYGPCKFPGCPKPKYCDPANNRVHDYCGRTHAYQARMQGIATESVSIRQANQQEWSAIVGKFQQTWAPSKGACPSVHCVFVIVNSKLTQRWQTYKSTLQMKNVEEYYHGTKLTCNITVNLVLCNDQECGVCGISNTGLDRRCIRKNIQFQRFGHGFYLAPNSSKCHDYTQGCYSYRAMLLFEVCSGNKYNLRKGDQKLKGPPRGFNSVYGQTGQDLNYEELVIYNPDAALPRYIIVYQKGGEGKIAK